jgi:hypothetical protein
MDSIAVSSRVWYYAAPCFTVKIRHLIIEFRFARKFSLFVLSTSLIVLQVKFCSRFCCDDAPSSRSRDESFLRAIVLGMRFFCELSY